MPPLVPPLVPPPMPSPLRSTTVAYCAHKSAPHRRAARLRHCHRCCRSWRRLYHCNWPSEDTLACHKQINSDQVLYAAASFWAAALSQEGSFAQDYGFEIDLWSAGCLLAEMFIGRPIMPRRTEGC